MKRLYEHHYIEEQRTYRDIEYTILLNKAGWRTAYLKVTGSVLEYIDFNDINLDVHGGLTYSSNHLPYEIDVPPERETWYIGWDYAHYADGFDFETVKKYFGEVGHNPLITTHINYKIYTLNDVRNDCIEAINKLHEGFYRITGE